MHAELGLMEFTARRLHGEPRAEAVSHADLYAGAQATVGILSALVQRARTGDGQHVDVSMAGGMRQYSEWNAVELAGGLGSTSGVNARFFARDGRSCTFPAIRPSFPGWCEAMARLSWPTNGSDAGGATITVTHAALFEEFAAIHELRRLRARGRSRQLGGRHATTRRRPAPMGADRDALSTSATTLNRCDSTFAVPPSADAHGRPPAVWQPTGGAARSARLPDAE
jgi:hypothetical protein